MKRQTNKKIRRAAGMTMLVCLLAISGISLQNLVKTERNNRAGRESYEEVRKVAGNEEEINGIDFAALYEINPDVVAWLKLDGTAIDYPVVQGDDNRKYLSVLFDGSLGGSGTLFADARHEMPFGDMCTIIYGHHMKDGSMFNALKEFRSKAFAQKNPVFHLDTPAGKYDIEVAAFLEIRGDDELYEGSFGIGDEGREAWIDMVRGKASYLTGVDMEPDANYVMLSTCAGASDIERYAVIGKLVPRSM